MSRRKPAKSRRKGQGGKVKGRRWKFAKGYPRTGFHLNIGERSAPDNVIHCALLRAKLLKLTSEFAERRFVELRTRNSSSETCARVVR